MSVTTTTYFQKPIKADVGGSNKIHPGNQAAIFGMRGRWKVAGSGPSMSRRDRCPWDLLFHRIWRLELHRVRLSRVLAYRCSPEPSFDWRGMLRLWPPEAMKALVAVTPLTPSCVCVSHVGGRDRRCPTTYRALLLCTFTVTTQPRLLSILLFYWQSSLEDDSLSRRVSELAMLNDCGHHSPRLVEYRVAADPPWTFLRCHNQNLQCQFYVPALRSIFP